jgi:sialate O-acetylesterase
MRLRVSPTAMIHPIVPKRLLALVAGSLSVTLHSSGEVSLPAMFSEHMVLQSGVPVPVWGWADPGEEVTVTIGQQTKTTKAGANKKWGVKLDPLSVGEPQRLIVKGRNTIEIADVLVGEVWLCSGQSNMAFTVGKAMNFEQEKTAADLPKIRMFTVLSGTAPQPEEMCGGKWAVCSPETVASFSAAGYFFGRELHAKLKVPVGLIHSSVGGTAIESWTSLEAQKDVPRLKFMFDDWDKRIAAWDPEQAKGKRERQKLEEKAEADKAKAGGKKPKPASRVPMDPKRDQNRPANLFNGKISPLIPYAIRGAIWYQGESNASTVERASAYQLQLKLLIADWRKRWATEFPFAWVQLPEYTARSPEGWALVREAMLKSLQVPGTGMAVALGLGDAKDIHPKNKQEVGKRLAIWALAEVYAPTGAKPENRVSTGPLYATHKISGKEVSITFTQAPGLMARDGELKGFTIAGEDKEWKAATAKIANGSVVVSHPEVAKPAAVRYAWACNPEFNLFNAAGLPASPFRTDDWPVVETPTTPP